MFFFNRYFYNIIKYDLINAFFYQNIIQIPKLKKIVLHFGYRKSSFKYFLSGLLALEFITYKKGKITKSKLFNLYLKIKKGNPVGCKIVLKKNAMYFFYTKLIILVFSKIKQTKTTQHQQDLKSMKAISFQLKNPLLFPEVENQFRFFKDIPKLDITLLTNSKSQNELFFLFKSIKLFL